MCIRDSDYTIQLEQFYNNLNSFRHDYLNILVSLEEGIRTEDIEMIKGVYHRVITVSYTHLDVYKRQKLD